MSKNRKDEHIQLARKFYSTKENDFDRVRFIPNALPEIDIQHTNISTEFLGLSFSRPFYINALTGGSAKALEINKMLGEVAGKTGVLIASGSVVAALKDDTLIPSFRSLREANPNGRIFANINANTSVEMAIRAIQITQADGLQIHLNVAQELIMPEGERSFSSWRKNIQQIIQQIQLPIIVKEVGCGMSRETIEELFAIGVKAVDISGVGGTNFVAIENERRSEKELTHFENWGLSTVESLLESQKMQRKMTILASGGVRNGMDIAKSLALGAKGVGISGAILKILTEKGVNATIEWMLQLEEELHILFTLLGVRTIEELQNKSELLFDNSLRNFCLDRGIEIKNFSQKI
ncbi:isopentenyl-diphosphate delta-isomerase [Pilibacter termitis]|uniref:Isopentenyl-diphosphate delta-isomerase n=2 Tax=Pilibacter termitis TaxID=263852 RepID=A0A1T4L4R9_9ENTE|nr:isopentenyl-diphosphate delta-isomerase [Pilibacter termitis]